jgi:hypothetical protein
MISYSLLPGGQGEEHEAAILQSEHQASILGSIRICGSVLAARETRRAFVLPF